MRAGADDFLLKPSDVNELKASIARALHWSAQTEAHTTELERRELQLAEAQQLAQVGSWEWDIERNVIICSDELYRIFGLDADTFAPNYDAFLKRIHPEDRERVQRAVQSAVRSGQPFEVEHRIQRQDGGERIIHSRGKVIVNAAGRPLRMFCMGQDITKRREVEERLGVLEELNRVTEEFIATASHDLKSPLTSIRGYTQLLLRRARSASPDVDQVAKGLAVIESQTAAMSRLVDVLLDASRIQAGGLELRTSPCDLGECLANALALLSPRDAQRVEVALPDAPLAGDWEQDRVEQVLANLVGNALKYSPETEPVRVEVTRGARYIEVAISDRGMGIPPQELPLLFERFHRTPQARSSGLSGTGLGLYICSGIITAHRGRIWAESPGAGLGATFRFTLPIDLTEPRASRGHRVGRTDGGRQRRST
jgi:PAS domain S-box-containing protein